MNILPVCIAVLLTAGTVLAGPSAVEKNGQTSEVKLEAPVSGHLADLNGKYKLRASETVYQLGGYIGEHHHAGPGIRFVAAGELTYVQGTKTTVYKKGDYFYESGDVTHTATNKTSQPVIIINFELLPSDWSGSSAIVPQSSPEQSAASKKP